MEKEHSSLLVQLLAKVCVNIVVVWFLHQFFPQYFSVTGGTAGLLTVGTAFGVLNFLLRPILQVVTLPLKLFTNVLAILIVNGLLLYIGQLVIPALTGYSFTILFGLLGWAVVLLVMGLSNWVIGELT